MLTPGRPVLRDTVRSVAEDDRMAVRISCGRPISYLIIYCAYIYGKYTDLGYDAAADDRTAAGARAVAGSYAYLVPPAGWPTPRRPHGHAHPTNARPPAARALARSRRAPQRSISSARRGINILNLVPEASRRNFCISLLIKYYRFDTYYI